MCTISLVPHGRGVRLVCNRDELRTRPLAEPPAWRRAGALRALWPRDPESGGTWIGLNTAGIGMAVLNRNPRAAGKPLEAPVSRGSIIPDLLRFGGIDAVLDAVARLRAADFEPFTLVVVERGTVAAIQHRGDRISIAARPLDRPLVFTSSSLGDHLVERPRRELFRRLVERAPSPLGGQAAFHRHRWPRRPEISVWMTRPDAMTVSRTVVDLRRGDMQLHYVPLADEILAPSSRAMYSSSV
jgi:hypothetical protein